MTQSPEGFGDGAAQMANETEVEASAQDASAPAGGEQPPAAPAEDDPAAPLGDTSAIVGDADDIQDPEVATVTGETPADDPVSQAQVALAERTADLQRLQAEYANYRKRVERDRQLVADNATYRALTPIIDVLDTIDRAREHGDLEPGLKAVADQLERTVAQQGLVKFGEPGDPFDPNIHEALSHVGQDADVAVTTCTVVARAGYRMGERVVRAAQVLVVDPADG